MRELLFSIAFLAFYAMGYSQDVSKIRGVVTDTLAQPLSNASVKAGRQGVLTDEQGRFEISITGIEAQLEVSSVGYISQTITARVGQAIVVELNPNAASNLSDVVIVGVQRQNKRNSIAALAGVTAKDIENRPAASVDALLQGRVAGLNVQVASGEPGVAPTVVVRGNTRVSQNIGNVEEAQSRAMSGPLYVIDGIPIDPNDLRSNGLDATGTNYLAGININDIENVVVQKDAIATAAWGSRGANGVIYITTKKGTSKRPSFYVNVYGGLTQRPKLLKTLTGAAEREAKLNLIRAYATTPDQLASIPQILTDSLNPYFNNATDWQGLFYRNGAIKNVDMSMSAATDIVNYRLSAGYYNETGIVKNTGFQRYSLRGNFGFTISPKLNSQVVIGLTKADRQRGWKLNNSQPNTPFEGSAQPSSFFFLNNFDRDYFLGLSDQLRNDNTDNTILSSITINYDILPSLRYVLQGSATINTSKLNYFKPSNLESATENGDITVPSQARSQQGTTSSYMWMNNLDWHKSFETNKGASHDLNLTLSHQYSTTNSETAFLNGYNTPSNNIQVVAGIPQQDLSGNSNYLRDALLSFVGQLQYTFNKKYLIYGSYRGDASSRFGANTKWGYFPAAGLGWIVSDEGFFEGAKNVFNFFKIRGSYGISGRLADNYYAPYNVYSVSGTYGGDIAVQPSFTNGLTKNDLTWAKSIQKNLGFDIEMFKSRVSITADVYDRLMKDDFYNFDLPDFTGYQSISFNARDLWVNNRGLDLSILSRNMPRTSAFQWSTQLILSFNKNKIAKLPNNNRIFVVSDPYGVSRIYAVGQPVYQMFQMQYRGVYNHADEIPFNPLTGNKITYYKGFHTVVPGDPIWVDVNGDGDVWSGQDNGDAFSDRVPTGDPNPRFTGGFTNEFSYKNFSLSVNSVFTFKRTVVNTFYQQQLDAFGGNINNLARNRLLELDGLDYWTPAKAQDPNYKANFPSLTPYGGYFYQFFPFTDMFNVDGSYFKIKQVLLNYQLPNHIINKLKVSRLNIYTNVTNLLILKNKNNTMPDPELVDQLGTYTGGLYPQPRVYTLGFNVTF
ncbi:SusC/RagA family TonB-linked outer membrane protein [Niabella insulamsoli]|uniref:SusC/RagA family TonB-linked outer membrane protein n=1 Tax=Niabella insulamsoli TaxID=3144874 RepID=UPI0031FE0537